MSTISQQTQTGRRLLQAGVALFLLGLLVGLAIPVLTNPRMGLASHLEAVMNGMFLVLLGLMWPKLDLSPRLLSVTFNLALFATYANAVATLLAAAWGTGSMMPIAAQGRTGSPVQELVVQALLVSLALSIVSVCVLLLIGLRGDGPTTQSSE